jgi:hypothetical protein
MKGCCIGRELQLPCSLLFGAPPSKEQPTISHAKNLLDHLHDIHSYAHKHLKLASDKMKTRYNRLASCAGYHKAEKMLLCRPDSKKGKSPKLQSSWESRYMVVI